MKFVFLVLSLSLTLSAFSSTIDLRLTDVPQEITLKSEITSQSESCTSSYEYGTSCSTVTDVDFLVQAKVRVSLEQSADLPSAIGQEVSVTLAGARILVDSDPNAELFFEYEIVKKSEETKRYFWRTTTKFFEVELKLRPRKLRDAREALKFQNLKVEDGVLSFQTTIQGPVKIQTGLEVWGKRFLGKRLLWDRFFKESELTTTPYAGAFLHRVELNKILELNSGEYRFKLYREAKNVSVDLEVEQSFKAHL